MKKFKLLMAAVLALSLIMAGCSKPAETEQGTQESGQSQDIKTEEPVVLTVWESTGGPDDFIKAAGEKFNETHPNITVDFVNIELGDTSSQIALDGPAGIGADLFAAPHDRLGELVAGGHVLATENADAIKEKVLSSTVDALTNGDMMYGYPISAETYALFYNKALISEADVPKTWDDLKSFAEKFNAENAGKYGFVMDVGNGYYTIVFTSKDNNRLFGMDGTDTENTNINNETAVEGMTFFQSLRSSLDYPAADLSTPFCDGAFSSGNVAMYITGVWNIENFRSAGVDFGVAPLPSMTEGGDPVPSFSGTRAMFVSAYSDHSAEAAEFAQFLLTDEMQALRFELTGALPSIPMEIDSPYIDGFLTQLDYAYPMPSIPEMNYYWTSMNAASANIWDGADVQMELNGVDAALKQ